jgi:hypothetical protein
LRGDEAAFDDRKVKGLRYRPHRMSLDRLSNASGYALPNLRLVHAIVNMTRGAATLQQMAVMKYLGLSAMGAEIDHPDPAPRRRSGGVAFLIADGRPSRRDDRGDRPLAAHSLGRMSPEKLPSLPLPSLRLSP